LKFVVVGSPVSHSLSPAMMSAAFSSCGMRAEYTAREIPAERWPAAMAELFAEGISGANVTVPHKERALAGAAEIARPAREIGAANTLVRREGGWRADNTDGPGFLEWIAELGIGETLGRGALVLGAGGAARAVVWALLQAGCPRVAIANRRRPRAIRLRRSFLGRPELQAPSDPPPEGGLVVNCTSLGLRAGDPHPMEPDRLTGCAQLLDLVYPLTPWVAAARARGIPAEDGVGLLVAQGALSFELWTGVSPDRDAMRRAVRREIERRG
jgi:shikimate dehydrogenase